ncbi:PREDICTED: uncharacterized protein LOC107328008 [Acropora digitifera]|uniref:uncharacterized protein LOC107328008 n=1 Tax=Acropora digitifera TaxID=70779 RepID=UPI00077A2EF2|nr:PREDICTED: uncharacterized protein LOC107328008 [Acropora digitifera]
MPPVYNLLFYINPQFYGYAAITKVLLKDVHLTCHYDSTLSCVSTDGNAVLTRFGLDTVNPYEHLVIMLGMTVLSLLLSWLFLEAKYCTPRCFSKTPPAFSVDIPLESVEVPVSPIEEPPTKEEEEEKDEIEMQIPSSRNFRINRYSSNRVSAKSRLGLIRENHGFHSVKLPRPVSPRAHSPEVTLPDLQSTDGDHVQFPRRRNRLESVMEDDLWKRTRQQMRERKTKLEHRMSRVENIARQFSLKPAQSLQSLSMRKKSNKYKTPPRRTTVASSAFSEEKRKELSLRDKRPMTLEGSSKSDSAGENMEGRVSKELG